MFSSRIVAWMVWLVASLFYAYQYILRVMPNIMMNDILQQFNINTITFGQFSGVYYLGYSLMHLPIGILLDRYGPKKVMPICIFLTVIGLLPILLTHYWIFPIIGRILIGMGSSAAILGIFTIIRHAFSSERFTRMLSLSVTIGLLGAIYGGGPVHYLCTILGYKVVVTLFAALGAGLSILTFVIVPSLAAQHTTTILADIKEVMGTPKVIAICCFAGLMVGPLEGFADVWGTEFLKQIYGVGGTVAASLPSAIFIGMCFGAPLLSLIAEKSNNYLLTIIAAGIIMSLCFTTLILCKIPLMWITLMFLAVGVCCAYQILAIYQATTYVNKHIIGLTTAVANMIIMVFGYAFHTMIGWVIHIMGGYTQSNAFIYGIAIIPIALTIGVIGFMSIATFERLQKLT